MEQRNHFPLFSYEGTAEGDGISPCVRQQSLICACVLAVIFILLVPVMEWPDAMDHISRRLAQQTWYPLDLFSLYATLPSPESSGGHGYFADHYMYQPLPAYFWVNLERLPVVLAIIVGLSVLAAKNGSALLLFCPPLIYSLAAPSQEVIAISLLLAAAIISHRSPLGTVLLVALSVAIDRSMAPSGVFVVLFAVVTPFRSMVLDLKLVVVIGMLLLIGTSLLSPLDMIGDVDHKTKLILGLTAEDIRDGSENGGHNLFALAASTMGLYGWMSIRPFPYWIYYPIIAALFTVGFVTSVPSRKSLFVALFMVSYLVLWLMPTLSQARYYPLLTLAFWGMVVSGVRAVKIQPVALFGFVITASAAGCIASLLNAL